MHYLAIHPSRFVLFFLPMCLTFFFLFSPAHEQPMKNASNPPEKSLKSTFDPFYTWREVKRRRAHLPRVVLVIRSLQKDFR